MNYNVKIDLMKLRGARVARVRIAGQWKRCICIPVEENAGPVEVTDDACYLSLAAFELKTPKDGQTHLVKVALPRQHLYGMSIDGIRAVPYIGNMRPWEKPQGSPVVRGRCMSCRWSEGAQYSNGSNFIRCNHPGADFNTTRDIRYQSECPKNESEINPKPNNQ